VVSKSRRPMACLGSTNKQDSALSPRRNCAGYLCVCPWQSLGRETRRHPTTTTSIVRAVSVVRTKAASQWKHLVPRLLTSFSSAALGLVMMVPSRLMLTRRYRCIGTGAMRVLEPGRITAASCWRCPAVRGTGVALGYKGYILGTPVRRTLPRHTTP